MTGTPTTTRHAPPVPSSDGGMGPSRVMALLVAAVALSVSASLLATSPDPPASAGAALGATTAASGSQSDDGAAAAPVAAVDPVVADRISRDPTDVGTPVGDRGPTTVQVEVETVEVRGQLADGTAYDYWTFGGTVPGPMVRARVGDTIEMAVSNAADSQNIHSIDLHAVNGPGGGATVTQVAPGEETSFSFEALHPGVYVYHCASPHIPTHIANGMYGLIVVEPEGGLPEVDREFYVMQGEIYTTADRGTPGVVTYDGEAMTDEDATYVVFNGAANALTGDHALTAEVGETVRLFVGNGGPNLISSFHVIGEILDTVHDQGASEASSNVQTTLVPAGGAMWAEFTLDVPGTYLLVDHAITRTIDKGALAMLVVEGEPDATIYDGTFPEVDPHAPADTDQEGTTSGADAHTPGDTIAMAMTEFAYGPDELELAAGAYTFAVVNEGAASHEWVLGPEGSTVATSGMVDAGETVEVEVELEPGTYEFGCHVPGHYEAGMKGTLVVTG